MLHSVLRLGDHQASTGVLLLHGLGADSSDLAPVVPHLGRPDLLVVLPTAPIRRVTINGGYPMPAWYDITSMDRNDPAREDPDHIRAATDAVRELMAAEGPTRWIVAGFSQGGAIALHLAWRHPEPLVGVLAMSTYLVIEDSLDEEAHLANALTPVLFCHGSRDDVVPASGGRHAHARWSTPGRDARWLEWPMGHEICLPEIRAIASWLNEVAPPP